MNDLAERMTQIFEETKNFYLEDSSRFAVDGEGCKYFMEDGRRCAVGRYLKNPAEVEDQLIELHLISSSIGDLIAYPDIKLVWEDVAIGVPQIFWTYLQQWHDEMAGGWLISGNVFEASIRSLISTYEVVE